MSASQLRNELTRQQTRIRPGDEDGDVSFFAPAVQDGFKVPDVLHFVNEDIGKLRTADPLLGQSVQCVCGCHRPVLPRIEIHADQLPAWHATRLELVPDRLQQAGFPAAAYARNNLDHIRRMIERPQSCKILFARVYRAVFHSSSPLYQFPSIAPAPELTRYI